MSKYSSYKDFQLMTEGWRSYLSEQEEPEAPVPPNGEAPESGFQLTDQTSFKVFDKKPELALQLMNELLQGGDLFKQLQAAQEPFPTDFEKLKKWVASIGGPEVFAKRAAAIGARIPEKGLPKNKMPFLPGPKDAVGDVKDVEDALKPGGKYNIDMMERTDAPAPDAFVGMDDPAAKDFMTAGHAEKDGDPNDDVLRIHLGGQFPAKLGQPTQTNILLPKALGMAVSGVSGGNLGAYASLKGHILDGHHRWAATMLNDPFADIGTFAMIDLEKLGVVPTLQYLTAIGNALGNKVKPA